MSDQVGVLRCARCHYTTQDRTAYCPYCNTQLTHTAMDAALFRWLQRQQNGGGRVNGSIPDFVTVSMIDDRVGIIG